MKLIRSSHWLLFFALLIPSLWLEYERKVERKLWLEDEGRWQTLIGTWGTLQLGENKKRPVFHTNQIFGWDDTGAYVIEEKGKRINVPFTYTLSTPPVDVCPGFYSLEITCDWAYCGGRIAHLDDSCLSHDIPRNRVSSCIIYIGPDRNHIYKNPYGSAVGTEKICWQRVELKPSMDKANQRKVER